MYRTGYLVISKKAQEFEVNSEDATVYKLPTNGLDLNYTGLFHGYQIHTLFIGAKEVFERIGSHARECYHILRVGFDDSKCDYDCISGTYEAVQQVTVHMKICA